MTGIFNLKLINKGEFERLNREIDENAQAVTLTQRENAELKKNAKTLRQQYEQLVTEQQQKNRIEEEQKKFYWGPKTDWEWNDKEESKLRDDVLAEKYSDDDKHVTMKILVFGPCGQGKSSFCNGCISAVKKLPFPSTYHAVGQHGKSFTQGFHGIKLGTTWIIDMTGIYESKSITSQNVECIASGEIPFYTKITSNLEVINKSTMSYPEPGDNDVSCVVIVLRYNTELGPEIRRQIEVLRELSGKGVISCHLVLTHLDECDPQFNDTRNLSKIFQSAKVMEAVKKAKDELQIPPLSISFVKNYTNESETDINTSILHLRTLQRIMASGMEQVNKKIEQKQLENSYEKNKDEEAKVELEKERSRLRDFVLEGGLSRDNKEVAMKILVFDPTTQWKSSFSNDCKIAIGEELKPSLGQYRELPHGFQGTKYGKTWIIDIPDKFNIEDLESITYGDTPFCAAITGKLETKNIPCIVIILRYDTELWPELREQIEKITKLCSEGGISSHIVLTHLEECDPLFSYTKNPPSNINSAKVMEAVERMSAETDFPPVAISCVKNYTKETDINTTILHLKALERIMVSGIEKFKRKEMEELHEFLDDTRRHNEMKLAVIVLLVAFILFYTIYW